MTKRVAKTARKAGCDMTAAADEHVAHVHPSVMSVDVYTPKSGYLQIGQDGRQLTCNGSICSRSIHCEFHTAIGTQSATRNSRLRSSLIPNTERICGDGERSRTGLSFVLVRVPHNLSRGSRNCVLGAICWADRVSISIIGT